MLEQVAQLDPASVGGHHGVIVERGHAAADYEDVGVDVGLPLVQLGEQQLEQVEGQHALQQRGFDDLAAAAALALD